jgi:hypothetical protein
MMVFRYASPPPGGGFAQKLEGAATAAPLRTTNYAISCGAEGRAPYVPPLSLPR